MSRRALFRPWFALCALTAALCALGVTAARARDAQRLAAAAPVRACGGGLGGAYRHVTARNVPCQQARRLAARFYRALPEACFNNATKPPCRYRVDGWTVRGRWFRDANGLDQQDLRATASHGRVVRFQTDWDGE